MYCAVVIVLYTSSSSYTLMCGSSSFVLYINGSSSEVGLLLNKLSIYGNSRPLTSRKVRGERL